MNTPDQSYTNLLPSQTTAELLELYFEDQYPWFPETAMNTRELLESIAVIHNDRKPSLERVNAIMANMEVELLALLPELRTGLLRILANKEEDADVRLEAFEAIISAGFLREIDPKLLGEMGSDLEGDARLRIDAATLLSDDYLGFSDEIQGHGRKILEDVVGDQSYKTDERIKALERLLPPEAFYNERPESVLRDIIKRMDELDENDLN